jgi:sodium/pantothenate symporter
MAIMLAQFIGGARLFEATTGMPYSVNLLFFVMTVMLYITVGGFRAVVLTDIAQGMIMLTASAAVLWGVVHAGGGLENIFQKLQAIDPGLVRPTGANNAISMPFLFSFWILVGLGILGLPQTVQKCMAFKDDNALRKAMIYGTVIIGFMLLCTHLTGALGRAVITDLNVGDLVMPTLIVQILPPFWAGIFIAGVLAAIMSTVSSMLIIASATIIRDLYIQWRLKGNEERANPRFVRRSSLAITAVLGICVFILALNPPDLLVWINLFAFAGLEAVFLWPIVLGLYWKKANSAGALCSVWTGLICFLSLTLAKPPMSGVHPIVPSLALSGIAFWVGNRLKHAEAFELRDA